MTQKYEIGKKYSSSRQNIAGENFFRGPYWEVRRVDRKYVLEMLASRQGGAAIEIEINKDEYQQLVQQQITPEELFKRHG